ncbi:MAG: hypothetical protein DI635_04100 [Pseudoxanthomonas suwonensis]|nr:MAG: hypothetical protein DI635_04100 [Pseudoxanthomonas suwonensis]
MQDLKTRLSAVGALALASMYSAGAMAQATGSDTLLTEFTAGVDKPLLYSIGGVVMGIVGVIFLIKRAQRAAS